ncbi:hypothetical protein EBA29_01805 [Bacillus velezensis]|nr:hypothetical protein EBA29_01805 [Bacillus velezensis]RUS01043.1 hypothetical protein EFW58_01074 [Bacillus velezensis]
MKAVRKIVIKQLKDYRALKIQLENKKESVDVASARFLQSEILSYIK